jgi:tRNA(adenine34) deaminase
MSCYNAILLTRSGSEDSSLTRLLHVWQPFYQMNQEQHETFMRKALAQAHKAYELQEVPVGAVIVYQGKVIAEAHNLRESLQQATAHAEVLAIEQACKLLGSWRLDQCTLYVTLEPCAMCIGAGILARLERVVFGAHDPKGGMLGSLLDINQVKGLNHHPEVISGILAKECSELLKEFFKSQRKPSSTAL